MRRLFEIVDKNKREKAIIKNDVGLTLNWPLSKYDHRFSKSSINCHLS